MITNGVVEWQMAPSRTGHGAASPGSTSVSEETAGRPLSNLARSAAELCGPYVRGYWLKAVLSVHSDVVESILAAVPGLSDITRDFTGEVIMINRERLSDALS
ncbi:MAG: hypothetical protein ABI047_13755 [Jatrophihabitantaceae bacterium]